MIGKEEPGIGFCSRQILRPASPAPAMVSGDFLLMSVDRNSDWFLARRMVGCYLGDDLREGGVLAYCLLAASVVAEGHTVRD